MPKRNNKKRVIKMVTLEVRYPSSRWPDWDEKIIQIVGVTDEYSGMGLGQRELGFTLTADQRSKAVSKLQASGLEGIEIV